MNLYKCLFFFYFSIYTHNNTYFFNINVISCIDSFQRMKHFCKLEMVFYTKWTFFFNQKIITRMKTTQLNICRLELKQYRIIQWRDLLLVLEYWVFTVTEYIMWYFENWVSLWIYIMFLVTVWFGGRVVGTLCLLEQNIRIFIDTVDTSLIKFDMMTTAIMSLDHIFVVKNWTYQNIVIVNNHICNWTGNSKGKLCLIYEVLLIKLKK